MTIITTLSIFILATALASSNAIAEGKKLSDKLENSNITIHIDIPNCNADSAILCPGLPLSSKKSMMCLMAYEDNLSALCKLGIIEASLILTEGILDIAYSIDACEADADKYCLNIEAGAGRIVSCLRKNESKITKQCISALKETNLWHLGAK